jgi:hypothetical protein
MPKQMSVFRRGALASALTIALTASCATAQRQGQQTEHDCLVALNKFSSSPRSEAHRWAVQFGNLHLCGIDGVRAMAGALRSLDETIESADQRDFALKASMVRHPDILAAALATAQNRTASPNARSHALQIALAQHNVEIRLLPPPERANRRCLYDVAVHLGYVVDDALPTNYVEEILRTADLVASEASAATEVRDAARCVAYLLRDLEIERLDSE